MVESRNDRAHAVRPDVPPRLPERPELRRLVDGMGEPRSDANREVSGPSSPSTRAGPIGSTQARLVASAMGREGELWTVAFKLSSSDTPAGGGRRDCERKADLSGLPRHPLRAPSPPQSGTTGRPEPRRVSGPPAERTPDGPGRGARGDGPPRPGLGRHEEGLRILRRVHAERGSVPPEVRLRRQGPPVTGSRRAHELKLLGTTVRTPSPEPPCFRRPPRGAGGTRFPKPSDAPDRPREPSRRLHSCAACSGRSPSSRRSSWSCSHSASCPRPRPPDLRLPPPP